MPQVLRESGVAMAADLQPWVLTAARGEDSQSSMDSVDDDAAGIGAQPTRACSDQEPGDQVRALEALRGIPLGGNGRLPVSCAL